MAVIATTPSAVLGNLTTDDLPEGTRNLYHTVSRVESAVSSYVTAGTGISIVHGSMEGGAPELTISATERPSSVDVSVNPPSSPSAGDMWLSAETMQLYVRFDDADSAQWVAVVTSPSSAVGGAARIEFADSAPATPNDGDLWVDTESMELFAYYDDGDSEQWVALRTSPKSFLGATVKFGSSPPANPSVGDMWIHSESMRLYAWYEDPDSDQWIEISPSIDNLSLAGVDTDGLREGSSNLWFTDERAQDAVASFLQAGAGVTLTEDDGADSLLLRAGASVGTSPPSDPAPGSIWIDSETSRTYLYYSDGDSSQWVETRAPASALILDGSVTTDSIPEGTTNPNRRYHSDSRARAAVSAASGAIVDYDPSTGVIDVGRDRVRHARRTPRSPRGRESAPRRRET